MPRLFPQDLLLRSNVICEFSYESQEVTWPCPDSEELFYLGIMVPTRRHLTHSYLGMEHAWCDRNGIALSEQKGFRLLHEGWTGHMTARLLLLRKCFDGSKSGVLYME